MVGYTPFVYEEKFKPKKIKFDRFNFKLGQYFLDNNNKTSFQEEGNPNPAFLLSKIGKTPLKSSHK